LLKVLYHTDSLYNLDPGQMQQWVVQQEDLLIQQTKMLQFAGELSLKHNLHKNDWNEIKGIAKPKNEELNDGYVNGNVNLI